jgi:hypothetical protein
VLMASTALALTACSSSSSGTPSAAQSRLSTIKSAIAQGESGAASLDPGSLDSLIPTGIPTDSPSSGNAYLKVDTCSLLSKADGIAVARADKLDKGQTASTSYTFTATKDVNSEDPTCRFTIYDPQAQGSANFVAQPGSNIFLFSGGKKVPGLGDEAYTDVSGATVMRVGDVMINVGNDEYTPQMTIDLLRKMAPNLR